MTNLEEKNLEEEQYLNLIQTIIEKGIERQDRTGTGTLSIFSPMPMRFDLKDNKYPLLTTKKVYLKGVIEELLWMIKGETDSKILANKKVHIWDGNGSREFLDKMGFTNREEGDLGPVYGFQWRHCGAKYIDCKTDYKNQGIDQLSNLIKNLKLDPFSRRHILTAWNPIDLHLMALPPCHMTCQFYVTPNNNNNRHYLSCQLYQRSADIGLGIPFNIASYALLTKIVAFATDMEPLELIIVLGDAHIYKDHLLPLKLQLERIPYQFPKLEIKADKKSIFDLQFDDFCLIDYKFYPKIDMKMSV